MNSYSSNWNAPWLSQLVNFKNAIWTSGHFRLFDQDGHHPYSPDFAPCDFCSFPKLRGCRYETTEEMKEAVTKVTDTLTQEDSHRAFEKLL